MTRIRRRSLLAIGLASALWGAGATAKEGDAPQLEFVGPPGCPDAAYFAQRIASRRGRPRDASASQPGLVVRAMVTRTNRGAMGRLTFLEPGRSTTERTVAAPDCREVTDALALIAAIALDRRLRSVTGEATGDAHADRERPPTSPPDTAPAGTPGAPPPTAPAPAAAVGGETATAPPASGGPAPAAPLPTNEPLASGPLPSPGRPPVENPLQSASGGPPPDTGPRGTEARGAPRPRWGCAGNGLAACVSGRTRSRRIAARTAR